MTLYTELLWYISTKNDLYQNGEDISTEQLMDTDIKKYEFLLTSENWNAMYPEQEQIRDLTTVLEKIKDDNLKLYNYEKIYPKKKNVRENSHSQ